MWHIGLTGNIGSGKTTVCRVFETLGIPVFQADLEARRLLQKKEIIVRLTETFGAGILGNDFSIDRGRLAAIVFNDRNALDHLNDIIHPEVRRMYEEWAGLQHAPYLIMEAAILFETGYASRFDKTILVTADRETRIQRVMDRDALPRDSVIQRMNNQKNQEELEELADFIVCNDEGLLVLPQILVIDMEIRKMQQG